MSPNFSLQLLKWHYEVNERQMPWKGERDPYRIWISEIILQQTRVEQGLDYYLRFISRFPNVHSLANAEDETVFKLWEGLGYYSRCRNLLYSARYISHELGGNFPTNYDQILQLKGVGPYTAAAIASFAFDEKKAVVDGNVHRVLSRYFGIFTPVDSADGKTKLNTIAQSLIPADAPAAYNQAIMDLGAVVCKPRNPDCTNCPLANGCAAYKGAFFHDVPVKNKIASRRTRYMNYFILRHNDGVYIRKRTGRDIWQNLYEFVLIETPEELNGSTSKCIDEMVPSGDFKIVIQFRSKPQQLSHQTIHGHFAVVDIRTEARLSEDYMLVKSSNLHAYAFPRFINSFLEKHPF